MSEKPRTWLSELMHDGTETDVIELEPVLDLLERWTSPAEPPHEAEVEADTEALLREHGRLK